MKRGLLGGYDEEPQGLFGALQQGMMNPMFLGGAALLSGEGMGGAFRGMQIGQGFQDDQRKRSLEQKQRQAFEGLLGSSTAPQDVLAIARMQGPQAGGAMLADWTGQAQEARKAELDYKRAQIDKLKREAQAGPGTTKYGKTGAVFQGPDGSFYTMQFAEDGTRSIQPVQIPGQGGASPTALTPARGVDVVGDEMFSRSTGATVRNVGPNLAEAERQKKIGAETGERQMGQPKAQAAMGAADAKSDIVIKTIGDARKLVGPYTAGLGGALLSGLPGTTARDLAAKIDTLKANAGFGELQTMRDNSPTGGALGQVAVQELAMLQSTITSLEQAQTPEQLTSALDAYETFVRESKVRRRQAYDSVYGAVGGGDLQGRGAQPFVGQQQAPANGGWSIQRVD